MFYADLLTSKEVIKLFKINNSVVLLFLNFKSLITILGAEILSLTYNSNFLEVAFPKEVGEIRL